MRPLRSRSLRQKLILFGTAASGAALLLACAAFVSYELLTFRETMTQNLDMRAEIVGNNSTAALAFNDPRTAEDMLSALQADPHVVAAAIFTRNGRLFATYRRADAANESLAPQQSVAPEHRFGPDRLILQRPIRLAGEIVGTVVVASDLQALNARLERYVLIALGVLIAAVLVALVFSARLQGVVSRPILQLVQVAGRVSRDKDYTVRAVKQGEDELGQLIDGFNEMLAQIDERDRQLREARNDLERRVEERTRELQQEIVARQRVEETIRKLAYYDALTGLPNRVLFNDRLAQALAYAERNREMAAVMLLDLDRFKTINDTLGHAMGDKVLRSVAQRLRTCLRTEDTVARIGGDEFHVLLPGVSNVENAVKVAEKIVEALRPPIEVEGHSLYATASVGVALFPVHGQDGAALIKHADTALYRAKDHGRDGYQVYAAGTGDRALERLVLENSLRRALAQEEFLLHYQPQVNPHDGTIVAIEALVRWNHPELGLLLPKSFVTLAEETGLILPLGEWVLRTACAQNRAWHAAGMAQLRMAVNLSARHFRQRDLVARVERILDEIGLAPQHLTLEVTEGAVLENLEGTLQTLRDLRTLGVELAVDDFGSAFSSLGHLKRLPVTTLKIDPAFVREIPGDAGNVSIIHLIITMAHSLGLKVVAEGVESDAELDFLVAHDCDVVQGDLFCRPVGPQELTALMRRGHLSRQPPAPRPRT
jgi:diguanylate cyclase (GGDEF)-like protein